MKKLDKEFLRNLLKNKQGYLLGSANEKHNHIIFGFMTENFDSEEVEEEANTTFQKIQPVKYKRYKVHIGRGEIFTAMFIARIELNARVGRFINSTLRVQDNFLPHSDFNDDVCLFKQGDQYLFYDNDSIEFLEEAD